MSVSVTKIDFCMNSIKNKRTQTLCLSTSSAVLIFIFKFFPFYCWSYSHNSFAIIREYTNILRHLYLNFTDTTPNKIFNRYVKVKVI